jgi:hypothetical protein
VVGSPYVRNLSTQQWISPAAFALSPVGTFGNLGSDSLLGPAYFAIDAAVSRNFIIKEKHKIELRFEFFNLTNHVNFNVPNLDSNIQDPTFGQILGDVQPRILQFAMKYTF